MNSKLTAVLVLSLLFAGLTVPIIPAEGDDALSTDDYGITIPGTRAPDEDVTVTIANGESASWSVYVVNESMYYLDVTFSTKYDCLDLKITQPDKGLLVPEEDKEHHNILSGTFTIAVDELSGKHDDVVVQLIIAVTDINDKTSTQYTTVDFIVTVESTYDTSGEYNKFLGIFENTLPSPFDTPWIPFLVTIAFWMVIAYLLTMLLAPRLAKILDKYTSDDDLKRFESAISKMITGVALVASFNLGLKILGADAALIDDVQRISFVLYTILFMGIAWKIYLIVIEGILMKFEENEETTIDMTLMPLFKMIGKIIFWVVGAFAVLGAFGVDLQGILVSAGVVSLGITMGAQNVLSQFFSGIVILMTRPFKKGDFLKINDKVYVVKKVKVMFTEFQGWDMDQIITMPNNAVTAATVVNLSKDDEAYRLYLYFEVAYGVDLKKAEKVMLEVAENSPIVLKDSIHAPPNVRLTSFLGSGIELRLGTTIKDFNSSVTAGSALRMAVYQAFLDNDIEIPYDRLEITMLNECFQGERKPGDHVPD